MADRVVKVSLVAQVNNYVANMEAARKSTAQVGDSLEAQKAASIAAAKAQGEAAQKIGASFLAIGAVAAVGVGLAIKKFAEFDQAISNVKAATQETAENMGLLREAALQAGAETVFSATEAANAIEELGKAGLSTADILNGGLDGALSLAAAGGLGVAEAAGIAATALKTFRLQGGDMAHVADLLAAGAGKAMGDVADLAGALSQAGLVANSTGLSIEETTGTLSAFASKGLLGSDAGTSFKAMLQRLTPQSKEASDAMAALGISAYDAQGDFIGMEKFAGNLQDSLRGLSVEERNAAMSTIFGSDAVRAATVLFDEGARGIGKWTDEVNDSGYAAKVAADRLDNLAGDVEALGGSFDTALIKTGSGANDMLRGITQSATGLINIFSDAPPVVQQVVLGLGLATAGIGLVGGAALVAVPKVVALKNTMATLNMTMSRTALAGGAIAVAVTAAVLVLAKMGQDQADAKDRVDAYTASLEANTGAFTTNTRESAVNNLEKSGVMKTAKLLGISLKDMADAALGDAEAVKTVNEQLAAHRAEAAKTGVSSSMVGKAFTDVEQAIAGTKGELKESRQQWRDHKEAMGEATTVAENAAPTYDTLAVSVDGVVTSVSDLAAELDKLNGKNLDSRAAARNLESAYDDFDAALKKNGKTLDITTEKGRDNQAALDNIAEAAAASGQAIVDADGTWVDYKKSLEASRAEVDERIAKLGITGQAAEDLAEDILHIPTESEWKLFADTEAAAIRLQRIQDLINGIGATSQLHISTGVGGQGGMTKAEGGAIAGPGTGTSDSIPAWLSNGEHVLTAREVARMGGQGAVYRFRQGIASGSTPRFASGGAVQYVPASSGFGGGNSTTNNGGNKTWNVTSYGVDADEVAAKLAGRMEFDLRSTP